MGNKSLAATPSSGCCPWLSRGNLGLLGIGLAIFVTDQLTKSAVSSWLPYGGASPVIDGFFSLVHVRNTGMAFSLFADAAPWFRETLLPAAQLMIILAVAVIFRTVGEAARLSRLALVLVLGGAAGNFCDRMLHGYVTDFLDFYVGSYHWPAFNVADSAITVGAALLLLEALLGRPAAGEAARPA